jgi:hypothetical protein
MEREWARGVVTLSKRFGAMLRQVNSSARDFKWIGKKQFPRLAIRPTNEQAE